MNDLLNYGWQPTMLTDEQREEGARVLAVHKERYEIISAHGAGYARLKSSAYFNNSASRFPTTGDFVRIQYNGSGDSQILETLPRKTYFSRKDPTPGRGEQAIAANFDYVLILQSQNHDLNIRRLERYLALAWESGAMPVVVLTKADLSADPEKFVQTVRRAAAGVSVFSISVKTGQGIGDLSTYLQPRKTIVLLGASGVGKSSLVNALSGQNRMEVQAIREDDSRGRHTTTHRQLIMLPCGAMIIDTPGMRELGMWNAHSGLQEAFTDVEACLGRCKYRNCSHETEPGCAVKEAIEAGLLSESRWNSYQKLQKEAKIAQDSAAYLREKREWHKSIHKLQKNLKKHGYKR